MFPQFAPRGPLRAQFRGAKWRCSGSAKSYVCRSQRWGRWRRHFVRPRSRQIGPARLRQTIPRFTTEGLLSDEGQLTTHVDHYCGLVDVLGMSCLWVVVGAVVYRRRHRPFDVESRSGTPPNRSASYGHGPITKCDSRSSRTWFPPQRKLALAPMVRATPRIRQMCPSTIRAHKDGIAAAVDLELSNGRHEGLNNKNRTMINRAYGFHTAEAALALIMLACDQPNSNCHTTHRYIHIHGNRPLLCAITLEMILWTICLVLIFIKHSRPGHLLTRRSGELNHGYLQILRIHVHHAER